MSMLFGSLVAIPGFIGLQTIIVQLCCLGNPIQPQELARYVCH
jgi:hypothetical protein